MTELHEWLSWLTEFQTYTKDDAITRWTLELVQQLEKSSNKISSTIDYWIDNVLSGFVTEFSIDTFVSYSKAERIFFKGPIGNFMCSLKLCIQILLLEKGTMCSQIE